MGLEPPLGRLPDSLRAALAVPNHIIAAHVHGKLAPELERDFPATLRQVEAWSSRRRALIDDYLRRDLEFKTDLSYQGLETGWAASGSARNPNAEWSWDQGEPGAPRIVVDDGPPGGTPPWVQRTFAANHPTRTFVAAGSYDSLNSCPLIAYQVTQLEPALRQRITLGCYAGGHMMYEDRAARSSLRRDLGHFLDGTSR